MTGFLTLEMRRCLRDVRYLVTALAAALPAMALVALTAVLSHHVQAFQEHEVPQRLLTERQQR
jgi:hypothetical protein